MKFAPHFLAVLVSALATSALAQDSGSDFLQSRLRAPKDPIAYHDRLREGIRLYGEAKYAEAASRFQSSAEEYPEDGLVWLYLGLSLRQAQRPKEAITAYERALAIRSSGQPMYIYQWLGRAHLEAGDKEGAYRALEKAVFQEQTPRRPELYDDPAFASLRNEPRFLKLVGRRDTSKMSRTEGWRTDIDWLISELKRVNHKYKDEPRPKEVTARQDRLKREVPKLTDDQIYVRMGHMLAPLNQGHVSLALMPESKRSPVRILPTQFYAFPEGVFIVGGDEKHQDLVGAEVLKIEETSPDEVLRKMEQHGSFENPIKIIWGVGGLGVLQTLRGLGVVKPDRETVRLTLRMKDGQTVQREITPIGTPQPRKLVPPIGTTPPLWLKNVPRAHWFERLPEGDALFVQLNQVSPDPDETMAQFGTKLRTYLRENPTKNVILDVRHNNGGNTSSYPEFLRTLVAHSVGEGNRLYVLIGRGVYSATGNLITDLERLANPVFVGEPSSGFGNQDGDESTVYLPYSGVRAWLTSVWWQYSHPWDKRTSVVPQVPVQLTAKDYFAGKDPVLETVLKMIQRS